VLFSVGEGREDVQRVAEAHTAREVSDDYNVYFNLRDHTVVGFVNYNESPKLVLGLAWLVQEGY